MKNNYQQVPQWFLSSFTLWDFSSRLNCITLDLLKHPVIVQIFLSFRTVLNCITNRIQLRIAKRPKQKPFTCLVQDSFIVSPLQRHIFFPSVCVSSPACPFPLLYFPLSLLLYVSGRQRRLLAHHAACISYPTIYLIYLLPIYPPIYLHLIV